MSIDMVVSLDVSKVAGNGRAGFGRALQPCEVVRRRREAGLRFVEAGLVAVACATQASQVTFFAVAVETANKMGVALRGGEWAREPAVVLVEPDVIAAIAAHAWLVGCHIGPRWSRRRCCEAGGRTGATNPPVETGRRVARAGTPVLQQ
ncbi:hypothetical protein GCM10009764_76520 [Nocardia ninae]|uniref:Uncharacterized protein n=1 Tax=Nocardia ninae NBRC 108245 TaxID=1210091 RepID=A0A511MQU1_9NOCA|nr:hypothetical protein NN4_74830 [Nocardia ninae NBRC 108245]